MKQPAVYPDSPAARNQWILARRPARNHVDPARPYAFLIEQERADTGQVVSVATIFLTNRECPWRCLMCDLWRNTVAAPIAEGTIPAQIDLALASLDLADNPASQIKLYNSGSFFDPLAIPPADYPVIAGRVAFFERVIVECHPALVGDRVLAFRELLPTTTTLEVAMGLETAQPDVLEKLNKRMSLDQFARAAAFLREHGIALRVFVLVKPPFLDEAEALDWAKKSIDFAMACGAGAVSLIPTRLGNGALEALAEQGQFSPPKLETLEQALAYGLSLNQSRVFADIWDLEKFSTCRACYAARQDRLQTANLTQRLAALAPCPACRSEP